MIKLFKPNETNFNHNQYVLSDCISCDVSEIMNGMFKCELEYPLFDSKGIGAKMSVEWIIKAPVPDNRPDQLFRICDIEKDSSNGIVKVTAKSIAISDLGANFIKDTNIVNKTRGQALRQILGNTMLAHKFTCSDDGDTAVNNLRIVRYSPIDAIAGSKDNTLINRYGGELTFDNFNIHCASIRTRSKTFSILHKKNLESISVKVDLSELITRIIPEGKNGMFLPEYYIDSQYKNNYSQVYVQKVNFNDIGPDEGQPTQQDYEKLRSAAKDIFKILKKDQLSFSYKVEFTSLRECKEYEDFKELETVYLGDKVKIYYKPMNLNLTGRVIEYKYDALLDRYTSITVGVQVETIAGTLQKTEAKVDTAIEEAKDAKSKIEVVADEVKGMYEVMVTTNNLSTIVKQNAESWGLSINGKLSSTHYNFDINGFTIGSSANGDSAIHTNQYSMWKHSDGTYSRADATGFYHNGQGVYHSLMALGSAIVGGSAGVYPNTITIQLPDIWKGKDFEVQVQMIDTAGGLADELVKRTYLRITDINKANATFSVRGYWTAYKSGVENEKELHFSYIVVGG